MNLRTSGRSRFTTIVVIVLAAPIAILASPLLSIDVDNINLKITDTIEVSWEDANSSCKLEDADWTLPSIYQLVAIHYMRSDVNLIENTDYWTRNSFAGYAFGLNTGLGIPSFDKHADTDHFLCVEKN